MVYAYPNDFKPSALLKKCFKIIENVLTKKCCVILEQYKLGLETAFESNISPHPINELRDLVQFLTFKAGINNREFEKTRDKVLCIFGDLIATGDSWNKENKVVVLGQLKVLYNASRILEN